MPYLLGRISCTSSSFARSKSPWVPWTYILGLDTSSWMVSNAARRKEEVPINDPVSFEERFEQKSMFKVDTEPVPYMRAPGNYVDSWAKRISHTSVDEIVLHFGRMDLQHAIMLECSNNQNAGSTTSSHPPWTNKMNNISRLQRFEDVYGLADAESGRCFMLRPVELWNSVWEIWQWQMHACFFLRTCTLLHAKLNTFVSKALLRLVEVYAQQLLSFETHFTANEEVFDYVQVFFSWMDGIQSRRGEDIWSAPIGLQHAQSISPHLLHFHSSYHQDFSLFQSCQHILQPRSSAASRNCIYKAYLKVLLALESGMVGANIMSSTVEHSDAVLVWFWRVQCWKAKLLGRIMGHN